MVAGTFQRLGNAGELAGNFTRVALALARRVERQRVEPDGAQAGADGFVTQVFKENTVRAGVGKGRVGSAAAGEFGVELDAVADIEDDQEGRPALFRRQGAGVGFGPCPGAQHGVVETLGFLAEPELLGFDDGAAAPVAVDEAVAGAAVAVAEDDAALEDVGVVAGVLTRRVGRRFAEQFGQLADEALGIGEFGTAGVLPAGDEGFGGHGDPFVIEKRR